jgi:hypothetical protein
MMLPATHPICLRVDFSAVSKDSIFPRIALKVMGSCLERMPYISVYMKAASIAAVVSVPAVGESEVTDEIGCIKSK